MTHVALGREAPAPNTVLNSAHVHGAHVPVWGSPEGRARRHGVLFPGVDGDGDCSPDYIMWVSYNVGVSRHYLQE